MNHVIFAEPQEKYKIVILVKETDLNHDGLLTHYVQPLLNLNPSLTKEDFLALPVKYENNKAPVKTILLPCLEELKEYILEAKAELLLVAAPEYYKKLTGKTKVATLLGAPIPAKLADFNHLNCFNVPSFRSIFFDDKNEGKIQLALSGLAQEVNKDSVFSNITHHADYPISDIGVKEVLDKLLKFPALAADIETFSLKHTKAKVATISFAWSEHEGTAFSVDLHDHQSPRLLLLLNFFNEYLGRKNGKIIFHNMNYDAKVLIYELFQAGSVHAKNAMIKGIELFTNNFEDTKLIAYLATNSCAGNELSLKMLALPFTGNYGLSEEEITIIKDLPLNELLEYNLKDALATFWVYKKYYPIMVQDNQENTYKEIFKPAVKNLLQMELHGMPISMDKVLEAEKRLIDIKVKHLTKLRLSPLFSKFLLIRQLNLCITSNLKWKSKVQSFKDFEHAANQLLNLNSGDQIRELLYTYLDLPVIDLTDSKQPSTSTKTLKKLLNHVAEDSVEYDFIDSLIELSKVNKILEAFIPAFKDAHYDPITDCHYLFGNFNLGGTVSGRLSCLTEDAMVQSEDGLVKITDVKVGSKVLTDSGEYEKVLNTWDNGIAPVFKINLHSGHSIEATATHKFLTKDGTYKSLEDLTNGLINRNTLVQRKSSLSLQSESNLVCRGDCQRDENQSCESSSCAKRNSWHFFNGTEKEIANAYRNSEENTKSYTHDSANVQQYRIEIYRDSSENSKLTCIDCNGNSQKEFHKSSDKGKRSSLQKQSKGDSILFNRDSKIRNRKDAKLCVRWKRLSTSIKAKMVYWKNWVKACFCPSCSNVRTPKNNGNTSGVRSTSCRFRQNEQSYLESCFTDKGSAFKTTSGFSNIKSIEFIGVKRVYDLEVENRHSYVANGITVHNCSKPNLQQIPSGSTYAKLIKACFVAPKGYLMVGLDFDSLEDYISALTTKDPNKLKVYEQGLDGHCLRAYSYFKGDMPDINMITDPNIKTYKAKVGDTYICFSDVDEIEFEGNLYTGKEFYEICTNKGV